MTCLPSVLIASVSLLTASGLRHQYAGRGLRALALSCRQATSIGFSECEQQNWRGQSGSSLPHDGPLASLL